MQFYCVPVKFCSQFYSFYTPLNKTLNSGILLNGVLIPKLLNNPFASCSFTNLDFLIPQSAHFDCIISPPFFALKIFEFKFLVFFLHFTQQASIFFYNISQ